MYSNDLIVNILKYIDENLYSKISIEELSYKFFFNKDYIMRLFKKETGMTIINYINKKRIYNSLVSLRETSDSILKIGLLYGYTSLEYYSETFNNVLGVSPKIYRNLYIRKQIKEIDIETIRINIANLTYELRKIDAYKENIKKEKTKTLSLFK